MLSQNDVAVDSSSNLELFIFSEQPQKQTDRAAVKIEVGITVCRDVYRPAGDRHLVCRTGTKDSDHAPL